MSFWITEGGQERLVPQGHYGFDELKVYFGQETAFIIRELLVASNYATIHFFLYPQNVILLMNIVCPPDNFTQKYSSKLNDPGMTWTMNFPIGLSMVVNNLPYYLEGK